jgi:hypothetical protein
MGRKRGRPAELTNMNAARISARDERWVQRAERVRDAFGLVLLLVLITYVLGSLLTNRGWSAVILCVATSATSIVALTSAHARPRLVRAAIWLAGLTVLLAVIAAASGADIWLNLASLVQVCLLAVAMGAVLARVVTTAEVNLRTILGAISVYTVLGILFSFVYNGVARLQNGSFFENHPVSHHGDFLFFSYTTLTTTGYGNLVPAGQPGRMIAGLEMMFGQIFLVTLVAGLVSLWRPGAALLRRRAQRASEVGTPEPGAGGPAVGGTGPTAD